MSDKRRPDITILLRYKGKSISRKVELFSHKQFKKGQWVKRANRYRVRVKGVWFPQGKGTIFYTKYEIRDMLWRSIKWIL